MKQILLLFCLLHFMSTNAQIPGEAYEYTYSWMNGKKIQFSLKGESDSLMIYDDVWRRNKKDRYIISSLGKFQLVFNKDLKRDEILDSSGVVIATTKGFYDIILPDGTFYDHINSKGKSWKYLLKGKVVVTGSYVKKEGEKKIVLVWEDSNIPAKEVIQIITQIFGLELIGKKSSLPIVIAVGVVTGIIRAASE